ncbi:MULTISPECIES: asparagine synthase-related protein [unclassified Streptomyces]|uniref:asparagine synthase-related protein n=1 Tax=unclassified Streptomyces TaxID=2593676 RepID=UPI000CD49DCB|nr:MULTISPECIES: asparagine synthase-related protein [unclassified Streptomyces]
MADNLPCATGFSVAVRTEPERSPRPSFASAGSRTEVAQTVAGLRLRATLLHTGAPEGACAWRPEKAAVVAGELYNRCELRSLLPGVGEPAGDGDGDAQLVLALFDIYDLHAFRLLNGRFAAVVVAGGRAVLATDHAGSVPLYTCAAPGRVLAATEAKTLRDAAPGRRLTGARAVPGMRGVHQVPAGTVLDIGVGATGCAPHTTWAPPHSRRILPEDRAAEAVRAALERAVDARTGPGTPLVLISGGIDSSGVAALAARGPGATTDTVSMGTEERNEFPQARAVAGHLGTNHTEVVVPTSELVARLPHTVWAAECRDPDIIEYLLPLTALYLRLEGPGRRVLTGYGADIPLGGMHREGRLPALDTALAHDMSTFDGLNEMTPVLSGIGGHWSTHPFWDREVLELLTSLEAGLKSRHGRDKWVLRAAVRDLLPHETVTRPKLGVHEGSGTTSSFTRLLTDAGLPPPHVHRAKRLVVGELFQQVVVDGLHPDEVDLPAVVHRLDRREFVP